jgi:hypothetical protein
VKRAWPGFIDSKQIEQQQEEEEEEEEEEEAVAAEAWRWALQGMLRRKARRHDL